MLNKNKKATKEPRDHAIMTSGHGSLFRFDGEGGQPILITRRSAIRAARRWESIADTIGGQARVVNLVTGIVIEHDRKR